ncbi:ABATE domain-containing protein [Paraburkholderia sp. JHI869]|uniref:CGNR zinc finger domain-containing protein n=1 Tax=Paraburkholderia sp. JHI869 TaxID=3112959 RepID=UPI0031764776
MTEDQAWNAGSFAGGALCLDFANTQGGRDKTRDEERLTNYRAAVDWASAAGAVSGNEGRRLRAMARQAPAEAAHNLEQLRLFRESLYRLFSALAANRVVEPADDVVLRSAVAAAVNVARLERRPDGCDWQIDTDKAGLNTLWNRIALDVQQLLLSSEMPYVRECERCTWLFVDRSKNKRRRWCKAETCGNRARASRHYQLTKA